MWGKTSASCARAGRNEAPLWSFTSITCDNSVLETKGPGMSDKTLTRMDLAEAVFREVGLSRHESAQLVESVLGHVSDALVRGEQVKISSFGTFSVRDKNERVGRNPKTGEEVPITPRRVLSFRPSHLMKERVAAGNR